MWVQKIKAFKVICPYCGSKITISSDEYQKYRKEVEGYFGSSILCQRYRTEDDKFKYDGHSYDIHYDNLSCPTCKNNIPMVACNSGDNFDAETWGFVYSEHVTPEYDIPKEYTLDDCLKEFFNETESEEDIETEN